MKKKTAGYWIKSILFYVLTIFLAGYVLIEAFAPQQTIKVFGFQAYRIQTPSMTGVLNVNDVVVLGYVRNEEKLEVGDIITFSTHILHQGELYPIYVTHYIGDILEANGQLIFKTQDYDNFHGETGIYDNSWLDENGDPVDIVFEDIVGRHVFKIPLIGVGIAFVQNLFGDPILLVLILVNVIIVYFVIKLLLPKKEKPAEEVSISEEKGEINDLE